MSLPLVIRATAMVERRELDRARTRMSEDEFRAFYERTARPLWAYLARLTGDRELADDLLQEAFYRFYRAGAPHESEAHRRHSLFQIGTNLARDAARSRRRHAEVPLEEQAEGATSAASAAPGPERAAAARTDLGRALRQLEPAQREILWLAYAQGASHEEIAQIVGVRTVSVRTLLFRARRKVAALLGGAGRDAAPSPAPSAKEAR